MPSPILTAAQALAPEFAARAAEGEAQRTMPADLVAKVRAAGLFRLMTPAALGGLELDPATIVEVIEEISRADGSAGWTVLIGNSTAVFAWLDPAVAKGLIGDNHDFASTSVFAPMGRAVADGNGGYVVDGRWSFNSGCPHAEWFQVGVFVSDHDTPERPRFVAPGRPDWRFAFLPRHQGQIIDTWDSAGLRGTGSHDVVVQGLRVPEEHMAAPLFEPARHDGPMWRIPFFRMLGILLAGFPLGVGRRALDELAALACTKQRGAPPKPMAEDDNVQVELGRAEAGLQAARAYVFATFADVWATVAAGDPPSATQLQHLLLAPQQAMRAGVEATDTAFNLAGAGAVYASHPLQRAFRDIHTANQHIYFSADTYKRYAKSILGIDQSRELL